MSIKNLVGFEDHKLGYHKSKQNLHFHSGKTQISSLKNQKTFGIGNLEIISLKDLRGRISKIEPEPGRINSFEPTPSGTDVGKLLIDPRNSNSTFQVASQFNLLEMVHPSFNPEKGVGVYWRDNTQGPACCKRTIGASLFRNYYVKMSDGQLGQTENNQINCLDDFMSYINSDDEIHWDYKNGYVLIDEINISSINEKLSEISNSEREHLKGLLKVGIHRDVQTNNNQDTLDHNVNLVLCSAFPLGSYNSISANKGSLLCQLILEATYEATIISAILNRSEMSEKLYLTKVGGGVFRNKPEWIAHAMQMARDKYKKYGLEIHLVNWKPMENEYKVMK